MIRPLCISTILLFYFYQTNKFFHLRNLIRMHYPVTVLCGDRVSQMTKTYNDIEAVTRLLEEVSPSKK